MTKAWHITQHANSEMHMDCVRKFRHLLVTFATVWTQISLQSYKT